ncbi:MAG: beta-ketoacyl synthase N-terminal-like domain-containing protein [Byssovorax sp.]
MASDRPRAAAVTALGMATAAGDGTRPTTAALRAGIVRLVEIPGLMLPTPDGRSIPAVGGVAEALWSPQRDARGLARLAALGGAALHDLARQPALPDLASAPLHLALPPLDRPGVPSDLDRTLPVLLGAEAPLDNLASRIRLYPGGHAAVGLALAAALDDLDRGAPAVIAGGADSLVEPAAVRAFHAAGRLSLRPRRTGFLPGEGAGFLLLEPLDRALARGATVLCLLEAPATADDPVPLDGDAPCTGTGLSAAIEATAFALDDHGAAIGLCYCDLNGEPARSEELASAIVRSLRHVPRPLALRHIADGLGDTGAASMALSIGAAATALHREQTRTSGVLVTASSDRGLKASVHLRAHRPGAEEIKR